MTHAVALLIALAVAALQISPRMASVVAAVRPVLPFPAASADGDVPADNSPTPKWFVVWPTMPDETRIVVKANPLNPDVQQASLAAMAEINAAIAAAERRAQASYDKAMEQLRKSGKGADLEAVTLDDEGVAGERIDAEQELTVELAPAESFDVSPGEIPTVSAGANGAAWVVSIAANTYQMSSGTDRREHFRAAESHVLFGSAARPEVARIGTEPRFRVSVATAPDAFRVVIRGNAALVSAVTSTADWSKVAPR
jgi:hypothetical protein